MAVTDISTFTQTKTIHLTMNLELASLEGAYLSQDSDSCYKELSIIIIQLHGWYQTLLIIVLLLHITFPVI